MCDDPRKPHRLRFDSRREEQKMRWKCEIILDMCQESNTGEDAAQLVSKGSCRHLLGTVEILIGF